MLKRFAPSQASPPPKMIQLSDIIDYCDDDSEGRGPDPRTLAQF